MGYLHITFLLVFAAWGWLVVKEDLAIGKIRNLRLTVGLVVCLIGYSAFIAVSLAGRFGLMRSYLAYGFYPAAVMHAAISLAVALTLWIWDVWPAGDAKFFILCAVFTPLISPERRTFPYFLSLNLLVNIFILAAVYLIIDITLSLLRSLARSDVRTWIAMLPILSKKITLSRPEALDRWRKYSAQGLNTAGIFLAQTLAQPFLSVHLNSWAGSPLVMSLLLFILWDKLNKLVSNRRLAAISGAGILALIVSSLLRPSLLPLLWIFLGRWLCFGVFFSSTRLALEVYVTKRITLSVAPSDIKAGMILSETSLSQLKQDRDYFNANFTPLFRDGLSPTQATALKQWLLGLPQQKSIEILKGTPFAIWILAGTLFTLAVQQNIAGIVMSWFH